MDNAARTRQRVLAIFLPVTAVLYISAEALSPKGTDQVISTTATALKVLPIAARHPAKLYVAGSRALLGLGGLTVSYAAIAALVRNRGSALATVAALIGRLGAFCGAITNVLVYPNLVTAPALVVMASRIPTFVTRGRRATGSPAPCARKSSWCPRPGITRSRSGPTSPPAQSCASWNRSRAVPRAGRRAAVPPGIGATAWTCCP